MPILGLTHALSPAPRMLLLATLSFSACTSPRHATDPGHLTQIATQYAAAWSSQNPDRLAAFYSEKGVLKVNAGAPAVGRAAVRATAQGFMAAFPDMTVQMDSVVQTQSGAVFHWTWTGTNTGPGGTGRPVRISGYEEWTFGVDGLIAQSLGHYDEAEYQRQVSAPAAAP